MGLRLRLFKSRDGLNQASTKEKGMSDIMRKIQILGAALFAVFAFAASTAASASATEFLISGEPVVASTLVYAEGELLLENMSNGSQVLCSGVLGVDIVNSTLAEVLEFLMLPNLELLNELGELNGAGNDMIDCPGEKTCEGEENLERLTKGRIRCGAVEVLRYGETFASRWVVGSDRADLAGA